jgi:DNA-binding CsgD family transcriptional regulator
LLRQRCAKDPQSLRGCWAALPPIIDTWHFTSINVRDGYRDTQKAPEPAGQGLSSHQVSHEIAHQSDRKAAEEVLYQAAVTFDECGAIMRHQETRRRLRQLQTTKQPAAPTGPNRGSLTRREHQVAALAADGYTAAQIATQLHIGIRTFETHLAHSYPQLGITRKQQLVHRTTELGLTLR